MAIETVKRSKTELEAMAKEILRTESDPFRIENKDPSKAYYFGNVDKRRLERLKAQGWIVSQNKELKTRGKSDMGGHVIGDVVLVERPKELSEAIRSERKKESAARMTKVRETLREEMARAGTRLSEDREDSDRK